MKCGNKASLNNAPVVFVVVAGSSEWCFCPTAAHNVDISSPKTHICLLDEYIWVQLECVYVVTIFSEKENNSTVLKGNP